MEELDAAPAAPSDAPQPTGFLTRFVDIHLAPERALRAIAAFPRTWWQPTLLLIVVGAVAIFLIMDDLIVPQMIDGMAEQGTADEQIDNLVPILKITTWASLLFVPLQILMVGLVGHLTCQLMLGGAGRYLGAMAVVAHALLVGVVEAIIRIPLMLAKGTVEVYLGPALLLPADMQDTLLFRVVSQLDVFAVWKLLLIGFGLAIVYRLAPQRVIVAMAGLWLVWILATALLGGLAGGAPGG